MINPADLRRGNLVTTKKGIQAITALGPSSAWFTNSYHNQYFDLQPIPLTPEVFAKCNIPDPIAPFIELYERDTADESIYKVYYTVRHQHKMMSFVVEINHLHHLQNLVYELTGIELNYTP